MSVSKLIKTSLEERPNIRTETRTADVILDVNGEVSEMYDKTVHVEAEMNGMTIIQIDNEEYPIKTRDSDKLFHTRKKYHDAMDIYGLPLAMTYLAFSTFLNIQFYFPEIVKLFDASDLILLVINLGIAVAWGRDRAKSTISIIYIKQYMREYRTIDIARVKPGILQKPRILHRGFTFNHLLLAFFVGIMALAPIAFQPIVYDIEYLVSIIAISASIMYMVMMPIFFDKDEIRLKNQEYRTYAPHIVEAVIDNEENGIVGYRDLGILMKIEGDTKEARQKHKESLEEEFKDKMIIALKPVVEIDSPLENRNKEFNTLISEVYRDVDFGNDSVDILTAEAARKILNKSISEYSENKDIEKLISGLDEKKQKIVKDHLKRAALEVNEMTDGMITKIIAQIPGNDLEKKTLRDIFKDQDQTVQAFRQAIAYLVQENFNRTYISKADKKNIDNLRVAYSDMAARKIEEPKDIYPKSKDNEFYKRAAIVGGIAVILLFVLWLLFGSSPNSL